MKIALVCPYDIEYPGGVQRQVMQFAERARLLSHDVSVIAPTSRKGSHDGIIPLGKTVPIPIGIGTVARLTFSFQNLERLKRLLFEEKFDVVHIHSVEAPMLGPFALYFAKQTSSAIVTTWHSNLSPNCQTWAYSTFARLIGAHRWADSIDVRIAVSHAAAKLARHYLPGDYMIIPNGIDTRRFSPEAKPIEEYLDGKVNILFVGRLGNNERRKGLDYLVSAFNELHSRHPDTRLLIVGPGKPDRNTARLASSTRDGSIVFVGQVSSEELPGYYQTADIFAATPTNGESFSLVAAEAMASGKPVVTSNLPGPREVLLGYAARDNNVNGARIFKANAGVLVQPRDIAGTAEALEMLVLDRAQRRAMGENGRGIVTENFSWDVVAPRMLEAYGQAIAARNNGSHGAA